jgi:GT2 family glycosyltransferase
VAGRHSEGKESPLTSLVIVTYERAECLERLMRSLEVTDQIPDQVIVVDASAGYESQQCAASRPWATYVRFPGGAGAMTTARNRGLETARGDLLLFLDDDTAVEEGWLAGMQRAYNAGAAAISGRTVNGPVSSGPTAPAAIGTIDDRGRLTANFDHYADGLLEIAHGIGANMGFDRRTVSRLGGFRDDFPGTAAREDTDMFLRVGLLGGRRVFAGDAAVQHLAAPHVRGARFDTRYHVYAARNHVVLIARNRRIQVVSRYLCDVITGSYVDRDRRLPRRVAMYLAQVGGAVLGIADLPRAWRSGSPSRPQRTDAVGESLRRVLSRTE